MSRKKKIIVVLPDTLLINEPTLREKTVKYSYILRSLTIFRVNSVIIYRDPITSASNSDREFLIDFYKYYFTPPYLRKKLIPLKKNLKYVGIVPPLRLNIFDVSRIPRENEYRIGLVVDSGRASIYVDAGLNKLFNVKCLKECPNKGELIVFKIINARSYKGVYDSKFNEVVYTGPTLSFIDDVVDYVDDIRSKEYYVLATSRYGEETSIETLVNLSNSLKKRLGLLILFGAPYYGLYDIFRALGRKLDEAVDKVLNTLPHQGTKTVRTEEALHATLALVNIIL